MTDVNRRRLLAEGNAPKKENNPLDKLSYDALLELAKEKGYDIANGKKREQLIAFLESATS